ncbi:MAG: anaerobic ribonucleoside-triphosphate reductase [Patescibacteria group bacterium]|nr:anaerobic ribonucleoside-triphosphate reductase [Patescibacteria group bacterium]MDD5121691.1 anaerobic ribonucleoside-triphosphate reductase [Patescibacteria group bacterium]MDD5221686.1 anaerobic ribonucleoside-triphosphate reductase [Patescibacteria group bacterium]MDD5396145.1 anaerobic ribonucleoside-triphosphate reductase [Patescibacteria group bacterium]
MNKSEKSTENLSRTRCEVYSRVVGYLRPVQQWNKGKKEEFRQRQTFKAKI